MSKYPKQTAIVPPGPIGELVKQIADARKERDTLRAECDLLIEQLAESAAREAAAVEALRDYLNPNLSTDDEIDAINKSVKGVLANASSRAKELLEAEAKLAAAVDAIQYLHDFQNGPPLPSYEEDWEKAMEQCEAILANASPRAKELLAAEQQAARMRGHLVDIGAFSQAHHEEQESAVWLHALMVDIPDMVDKALAGAKEEKGEIR